MKLHRNSSRTSGSPSGNSHRDLDARRGLQGWQQQAAKIKGWGQLCAWDTSCAISSWLLTAVWHSIFIFSPGLDAHALTHTTARLGLCRSPPRAVSDVSNTHTCTSDAEIPALRATAPLRPLLQPLALGSSGGAMISPFLISESFGLIPITWGRNIQAVPSCALYF